MSPWLAAPLAVVIVVGVVMGILLLCAVVYFLLAPLVGWITNNRLSITGDVVVALVVTTALCLGWLLAFSWLTGWA